MYESPAQWAMSMVHQAIGRHELLHAHLALTLQESLLCHLQLHSWTLGRAVQRRHRTTTLSWLRMQHREMWVAIHVLVLQCLFILLKNNRHQYLKHQVPQTSARPSSSDTSHCKHVRAQTASPQRTTTVHVPDSTSETQPWQLFHAAGGLSVNSQVGTIQLSTCC